MKPNFAIENKYENKICFGVDEAGRGPIAGPVVAGAVFLEGKMVEGINDSKKISKRNRYKIFDELVSHCKYGIGIVEEKIIDEINILQATKLAMLNAVLDLQKKYDVLAQVVLVDGNFLPFEKRDKIEAIESIVKGDQQSLSIAAASIIAKVTRDNIMFEYDKKYPEYGFKNHQGYPTKFHIQKINEYGVLNIHRKTFAPISGFY
ncbi:MAG: ribonuclease HII [Rickettsiales bacterium]|nr:ribonuclease HII [Rickettsiales bacterium]